MGARIDFASVSSQKGFALVWNQIPLVQCTDLFNLLKPTGHVMYQKFNIQQLYVLTTLYLSVSYLSENKQRLVPLTLQTDWFL